ncbi:MAG: ATP-binding protein [Xanthomonadales bacterium]|nr:ATP-binding protein [Xanthomonadales bacterium]
MANSTSSAVSSRPAKASPSIVRRLLIGGTLVVLLSMSAVGLVLDKAFAAATRSAIHERLENTVYLLLAVIQTDQEALGLNQLLPDERLERAGSGLYAGVLTAEMDWRSHSALTEDYFDASQIPAGGAQFSFEKVSNGRFVLSMGLEWENEDGSVFPMTVWAAQHRDDYDRQMLSYRRALWPWLGAVAVLILAVQFIGMWLSMRPLKEVEAQVKAVETGAAERLDGVFPRELTPLTDNVNALLINERGNRERYRRALGDLAHSLKTPIAVLQQSLMDDQPSATELQAAHSAIDDMRQTISRQLERAASATRRTHALPILVLPIVERIQNALSKVYFERAVKAELQIPEALQFYGEERDLMEMIGNLMENAYKYGGQQVRVMMRVDGADYRRPGMVMIVEDDGPGISEADFQRLLKRGERGDQQAEGQGLGLSIVAELVHAYDAQISLQESTLGGAALKIQIPPV